MQLLEFFQNTRPARATRWALSNEPNADFLIFTRIEFLIGRLMFLGLQTQGINREPLRSVPDYVIVMMMNPERRTQEMGEMSTVSFAGIRFFNLIFTFFSFSVLSFITVLLSNGIIFAITYWFLYISRRAKTYLTVIYWLISKLIINYAGERERTHPGHVDRYYAVDQGAMKSART